MTTEELEQANRGARRLVPAPPTKREVEAAEILRLRASNAALVAALHEIDVRVGGALVGLAELPERKLVMSIRHVARTAIAKIDTEEMAAGFEAALDCTSAALKAAE